MFPPMQKYQFESNSQQELSANSEYIGSTRETGKHPGVINNHLFRTKLKMKSVQLSYMKQNGVLMSFIVYQIAKYQWNKGNLNPSLRNCNPTRYLENPLWYRKITPIIPNKQISHEKNNQLPQRILLMNNPSITDIVRAFDRELRRELNDRLPRRVEVIAVNHFKLFLPMQKY